MPVTSTTNSPGTSATTDTTGSASSGFNGLTADDFLKLLIAQLKNQDPTAPTSNEQLLNQIATMRGLQSNIELSDVLKQVSSSLTSNSVDFGQKLSTGASYIGQSVTLDDTSIGVVDRAFVINGDTYLGVDGQDIPISRVVAINTPESFVGQLVVAQTSEFNDDGSPKQLVASVIGAHRDSVSGETVLTIERPDSLGKLTTEDLNPSEVKRAFNGAFLVGQTVSAVTADGRIIQGVASAATVNQKPALSIKGESIPYERVTGISL